MNEPCPQRIFIDFGFGAMLGGVLGLFRLRQTYEKRYRRFHRSEHPLPLRKWPTKVVTPWFMDYQRTVVHQNVWHYNPIWRFVINKPAFKHRTMSKKIRKAFKKAVISRAWTWGRWGGIYSTGCCAMATIWGEEGMVKMANSAIAAYCMGFVKSFKMAPFAANKRGMRTATFILAIEFVMHEFEMMGLWDLNKFRADTTADTPIGTISPPEYKNPYPPFV